MNDAVGQHVTQAFT